MLVSTAVCMMVIIICLVVSVRSNEIKAQNNIKQQEIEHLQQLIEQEKAEAKELEEYAKYVNTKQFVEQMAREKLGLIYPGELIFIAD